jgi:hypothetical protein
LDFEIVVPNVPDAVLRKFNAAWGYPNGEINREPKYAGEPGEHGLGEGSLVPTMPEPEGFKEAALRLHGGKRQWMTLEIYSDGERRVVPKAQKGT